MMMGNKKHNSSQQGNVMVYVLIALALIGFLTLTLSRQNDQADSQGVDDEQLSLYVQDIMTYVASAQGAVDMMLAGSSEVTDLDPIIPIDANFDTGTPIHKIFHPLGGGLVYQESYPTAIQDGTDAGWKISTGINVQWTETGSDDVLLTAYFISRSVCEEINRLITGSTTIPATANPHTDYFIDQTTNLTLTECADCDGYPSLCVENDTGDGYSFYNVIAAQ